jgi:hypothetical protein
LHYIEIARYKSRKRMLKKAFVIKGAAKKKHPAPESEKKAGIMARHMLPELP